MFESKVALLEADCLVAMKSIPDRSVNMVLCDLPYGTTQNKWDSVIPLDALWHEYKRILAPKGVVVLTGQGPFTARLICSQENLFKYKITWVKSKATNFLNAKKQPLRKHEDICVFYQEQPFYTPQMSEGTAYDKGVRKDQLTGSYGEFDPVRIKSEGGRYPTDVVYFKTAENEGQVYRFHGLISTSTSGLSGTTPRIAYYVSRKLWSRKSPAETKAQKTPISSPFRIHIRLCMRNMHPRIPEFRHFLEPTGLVASSREAEWWWTQS